MPPDSFRLLHNTRRAQAHDAKRSRARSRRCAEVKRSSTPDIYLLLLSGATAQMSALFSKCMVIAKAKFNIWT
jgi:hypothetical protein